MLLADLEKLQVSEIEFPDSVENGPVTPKIMPQKPTVSTLQVFIYFFFKNSRSRFVKTQKKFVDELHNPKKKRHFTVAFVIGTKTLALENCADMCNDAVRFGDLSLESSHVCVYIIICKITVSCVQGCSWEWAGPVRAGPGPHRTGLEP